MIFVILGMHKSGTTLISQTLHRSQINMGNFDESVTYDQGNQYERHEAQKINLDILGCGNANSLDVISPTSKAKDETAVSKQILAIAKEQYNNHNDWGFKDPRTSLTYPIWKRYLPEHKVIYVFRDPWELCGHYIKTIPKRKPMRRIRQGVKALRAWYVYNKCLLDYLEKASMQYCIINFNQFMNNEQEFINLKNFVNIQLVDCRKRTLYRSKPANNLFWKLMAQIVTYREGLSINQLYNKLIFLQNHSTCEFGLSVSE